MSTDGRPRSPQSWEHLLEKDPHGGTRFRLGIMAAVLIHAGIFAITWPTVAQAPPAEPEPVLIPVQLANLAPPEPEPEIIRIEVPERPPVGERIDRGACLGRRTHDHGSPMNGGVAINEGAVRQVARADELTRGQATLDRPRLSERVVVSVHVADAGDSVRQQ